MKLCRLLYYSKTNSDVDLSIDHILKSARRFNESKFITGMLWFDGDYFIQILEGSRENINLVYERIFKDKRHHTLTLMDFREVNERIFPSWNMGYYADVSRNRNEVMRFSITDQFRPDIIDVESLTRWMKSSAPSPIKG